MFAAKVEESPLGRAVEVLRRVKYLSSRQMSPKMYWYIMGRLRPVPAVTSDCATVSESMASGERIVALLDRLDVLEPNMTTLHIGSGLGRIEAHLRDRVKECYGVDISPSMVKRASVLVRYDNVTFLVSDGETLSQWPGATFDLIYSFLVFQHLPRAQFNRYIDESQAKLKTGGYLVFQLMVDEFGLYPDPPPGHPYGIRYYRRADVVSLLERTGLTVVSQTDLDGAEDGGTAGPDVVFCARKR